MWGVGQAARPPPPARVGATADLDRYVARDSMVHRADARLKFLLAMGPSRPSACCPRVRTSPSASSWARRCCSRPPRHAWGRSASRVAPGSPCRSCLSALPLLFTRPGEPVLAIPARADHAHDHGPGRPGRAHDHVSRAGSASRSRSCSRTPPRSRTYRRRSARSGCRRIMVSIISFMYRYLAVLTDEAGRMNRARAARSAVVRRRRRVAALAGRRDRLDGRLALPPLVRALGAHLRGDAGARLPGRAAARRAHPSLHGRHRRDDRDRRRDRALRAPVRGVHGRRASLGAGA